MKTGDKIKVKVDAHTAFDGMTGVISTIENERVFILFDCGEEDELSLKNIEVI